jgi:hypothetical protein
MLAADRVRADAFDLGGDPESGAVAPGEVAQLSKLSRYTPQTWNEALSQLLGMQALMGALLGHLHPVVTAYGRFLRRYRRMLTRLEFEIDHAHRRRLGPAIMTFHVQLAWRNWMVLQLDTGETDAIDPPDFGVGLTMLETQHNLMWLPSVTNVPLLLAARARAPAAAPAPAGNRAPNAAAAPPAVARRDQGRDQGRQIRNTARPAVYTGNMPFSKNIRARRVTDAIALAGPPSVVTRSGVTGPMCVSWHVKGQCFEHCDRMVDHRVLASDEAALLLTWCQAAYA